MYHYLRIPFGTLKRCASRTPSGSEVATAAQQYLRQNPLQRKCQAKEQQAGAGVEEVSRFLPELRC